MSFLSLRCLVLIFVCCHVVLAIEPLLSSPSNTTILVIVDVHRNYDNNGSCTDPIWDRLELAYSLWFNHVDSKSEIGIEIYDGCSSLERTISILHERVFPSQNNNGKQVSVASVVTLIRPEVDDAISGTILMSGITHVTLGSPLQHGLLGKQTDSHLYIDLSPRSSVEVLKTLLKMLDWTYLTVISDGNHHSAWKHQHFLSIKDDNTCIQDSVFNVSSQFLHSLNIKTDGVLMFMSTAEAAVSAGSLLPPSKAVVIVTQDTRMTDLKSDRHAIILTDSIKQMDKFVDYMSDQVLQSPINPLLSKYFTHQHNCSFNSSSGQTICPDLIALKGDLYSKAGEYSHTASVVINVLARTASNAIEQNCTEFHAPECFDVVDIADKFDEVEMGYMVPKAAINASIEKTANGSVQSTFTLELSETAQLGLQLASVLDSVRGSFPDSQCSSWCPACESDGCKNDNRVPFNGQHAYTDGDVIIAGMFPLTNSLKLGPESTCSGFSIAGNTDVLVEAFMYAIRTAKTRYSGLLQNVTIGSLVFDTCSDTNRATQTVMNFESCQYTAGNGGDLVPAIVPAYITYTDTNTGPTNNPLNKLQLSVTQGGKIYNDQSLLFDDALFNQDAIISVLRRMEWTHVGIITSSSARSDINMKAFFELAARNDICIVYDLDIDGDRASVLESVETIKESTIGVFVIFANSEDVDSFFRELISNPITKTWIVVGSRKNWYDFNSVILPSGSLLLQGAGKVNADFDTYIENKVQTSMVSSPTSWLDEFQTSRDNCDECELPNRVTDTDTKLRASDIIRAVDVTLHALDIVYRDSCTNRTGPCRVLYTDGFKEVPDSLNKVRFNSEGESIDLMVGYQIMETYVILNIQSSMIVEIGSWRNGVLDLEKSSYKAYSSSGNELPNGRRSICYSRCECININPTNNGTSSGTEATPHRKLLDPEMGYQDSTGEFNTELWCIVVVIIAGSGAFATLCLMFYVMCKVCAGALVRRYLALGLMLLIAMVLLFISVLPFVFTPSEAVCGMRYFAHGFSYAFCFAIVLTKMTTLRNYKYIGLGGEISRINQLLSVFFITGVQIAIGIEWWVLRTPVVLVEYNSTIEGNNSDSILRTHYACDLKRGDFLAYHSFVIFLICVCCAYSIGVRKETNNMKEARLLLVSSFVSLVIWIAIIVTLLVMDRDFLEAICAVGILANALTLMVVIYFPKLTVISQLKYEVSDQKHVKANGYKIDSDFQFERVYSMPGTLHSSVTDKSSSFPRSNKAFDTSLSY